jgi:glycosyltransferase involved in cell wall biosynthesis
MTRINVAANRGDIGGGEVMLLRISTALAELGFDVRVVVPSTPSQLAGEARATGLTVEEVPCRDRASYGLGLRRWDRQRTGVLWCNGLLPALATAGGPRRVVHLHQLPQGPRRVAAAVARRGALATLVPSDFLRQAVRGSRMLPNWTDDLDGLPAVEGGDRVTVGSLGRIGRDKGTDVLAEACRLLEPDLRRRVRLVVAGDDRFVPDTDRDIVARALAGAGVEVQRPGWVDPREFFAEVDVTVFASVRPESFGLGAAEAMSARRPLVVSDAGALPEVAGPGHPWVAPRGDAVALAEVLASAIRALPATGVVAEQRARWEAEYSPAAGRRHLAELMEHLAAQGVVGDRS